MSIALSDSLYNAIVSQSTTNVNLGVDFAVYPVLGDISYKVDSGALTKITYTKDEPNFGWLTCFSTPTYSLPARLPYGIMTSALHATALAADVALTSFVRARLLDKVVDLYDDYSSSPYYASFLIQLYLIPVFLIGFWYLYNGNGLKVIPSSTLINSTVVKPSLLLEL